MGAGTSPLCQRAGIFAVGAGTSSCCQRAGIFVVGAGTSSLCPLQWLLAGADGRTVLSSTQSHFPAFGGCVPGS